VRKKVRRGVSIFGFILVLAAQVFLFWKLYSYFNAEHQRKLTSCEMGWLPLDYCELVTAWNDMWIYIISMQLLGGFIICVIGFLVFTVIGEIISPTEEPRRRVRLTRPWVVRRVARRRPRPRV
jgi:hypothetical protein